MTTKKSTRHPCAPNTAYLPACGDLGDKEKKLKGAPVGSAAGRKENAALGHHGEHPPGLATTAAPWVGAGIFLANGQKLRIIVLAAASIGHPLVSASNPRAASQPARPEDEHSPDAPDAEENQGGVHGSVLALVAPLLIHGALEAGISDGNNEERRAGSGHKGTNDAEQAEEEVAHWSGFGTRRAGLDERFERHFAFGEVAHGEHELRRNAVVSHLGDATRRDAESISERFGSAALRFEPSFEIHGASLEQPKRSRQCFSKPRLFKLGTGALSWAWAALVGRLPRFRRGASLMCPGGAIFTVTPQRKI